MNQPSLSPRSLAVIRSIDRLFISLARHWLLLATLLLLLFSGLPWLAPVLVVNGYAGPAQVIYTLYSFTCHQLAYRSYFVGGLQPSYSIDQLQSLLHVDNPLIDVLYWRAYQGDATLGYKVAFCERDVAIYGSMLLASLAFGLARRRLPKLSWQGYVLIAILPMLLDGGTQLVGLRESDPLLRTITGLLFGALTVWLTYPYVQEAMRDILEQTSRQLKAVDERLAVRG
ncbi:MAG: DUF2085 domain-containing protein [Anaerolineae bacterium]